MTTSYAIPLLPRSTVENAIIDFDWQGLVADQLVESLGKHRGVLLRGGTGYGKMYVTVDALSKAYTKGLLQQPEGSINPTPILWLCPKSVKQQTLQVLKLYGISHLVMVLTYGQLKNKDGTDIFLSYETKMERGQPVIVPVWSELMLPAIVVCDEAHKLKNPDSRISRVVRALPAVVKWLGITATPVQRVIDGRYIVECCSAVTKYNMLPATEVTSPAILREIAYPKSVEEYSPSATERFRDALDDYIVEMKTVRFKFPTKTACTTIYFATEEERRSYERAYEEYLTEIRKIRRDFGGHGRMAFLVAMRKFQQKAELLRCPQIAERCAAAIAEDKQVIIASNFKDTLRSVWTILVKKYKLPAERIAYIVGGQSEQERQTNIDKFQQARADAVLFTMTAGGVGISLHHDRVSSKPRHIILPPTWSAIDLVQALGRGHRLTSLSPTTQEILWYGDTVEDRVKVVVQRKVKCLSKAIVAKEQFMSMFEKLTDDIDEETNEEYIAISESDTKPPVETSNDDDSADESFTGEGLDSVDEFPTNYK